MKYDGMVLICEDRVREVVEQANIVLRRADTMLEAGLNEDAARAAYLACFHVAQAYIFERTRPSRPTTGYKGNSTV
jgi:uncharacterized protein (UPF0332 family)